MLISLLFIVLLRFLAGIMVWVMIVMVILVIGYGKDQFNSSPIFLLFLNVHVSMNSIINKAISCVPFPSLYLNAVLSYCGHALYCTTGIFHCSMEYVSLKSEAGSNVTLKDLGFQTDFSVYLHIRQTWLAFSKSPH